MKLLGTILLLALLGAGAAGAQPVDLSCSNGSFPTERAVGLAKVSGSTHLVFLKDSDGCPNAKPSCLQRAYVLGGDQLLTGRTYGAYTCAFYPSPGGGSAGWVPSARLSAAAVVASPPLAAWAGHWANMDDTIDLKVKGGALEADGDAYWPSAHPSPSQFPGGPNVGDLSGSAAPKGNVVVFTDNDPNGCTATATLVGTLLVVADNGGCGGQNVSFSAVYKRN
jgi:hypothetical protein